MNLNKFLRNSLIVIGILIIGFVFLLVFNFNKGYDFNGGTVVNINIQQTTYENSETLVKNVLSENKIDNYTITRGDNTENGENILIVKYQLEKDIETTNNKVEADLFEAFEYSSTDITQSNYIKVVSNLDGAYSFSVFTYAFLAILAFGVASAIYMSARHGLAIGFSMITQLILDIGLTLSLVLITRLQITSLIGVAIMGVGVYSLVISGLMLINLVNNAKQEKYAKTSNKEIANITIKESFKSFIIFSAMLIVFALIMGLFIMKTFISPIIVFALAVVVVLFTSHTITPMLWANSYKYKKKMKKIGVDPKLNPDNSHV